MFSLPEYIIVSRAAKVIENSYVNTLFYKANDVPDSELRSFRQSIPIVAQGVFGITDPKYYYNLQKTLEDILEIAIPGCTFTRFISVYKSDMINKRSSDLNMIPHIPILLVEVATPHLYLPIFIGSDYVFFISPFGNSGFKEQTSNYYVYPLFKTEILTNWRDMTSNLSQSPNGESRSYTSLVDFITAKPSIPTVYKTYEASDDISFAEVIRDILITKCGLPIEKQISLISTISGGRSYYDQETISTESELYKEIMDRYSIEAVDDTSYDTMITPDDYMPIAVQTPTSNIFGHDRVNIMCVQNLAKKKVLGMVEFDMKDANKNSPVKSNEWKGSIIIKSNKTPRFIVSLPATIYEIPKNRVVIVDEDNIMNPILGVASIDESFDLNDDVDMGTESFMSDAIAGIKKAGIKMSQGMKELFRIISKYPFKIAKIIYKDIRSFFKRFDKELEKSDSLEYREKVLNDELDQTKDMLLKWTRVITFTGIMLALTGNVFIMFLSLIFWRIDDNNTRVRAINRQIKSFNEAIKRIDFKIDAARQESRYEDVDNLLKEKQMLTLGRRELIQLKRRNYEKADEANKKKYGDFDSLPDEEHGSGRY